MLATAREDEASTFQTKVVNGRTVYPKHEYAITSHVFDARTGKLVHALVGHGGAVITAAFDTAGSRLITGSYDKTAKVWDLSNGRCLVTLSGHEQEVSSVALSPDGRKAVTTSWDKTVRVWDVDSGQSAVSFRNHKNGVISAGYSADGSRIISMESHAISNTDSDKIQTVRVWLAYSGTEIATFSRLKTGSKNSLLAVLAAKITPDGKQIITVERDHSVKVWDVSTQALVNTIKGDGTPISIIAIGSDGVTLALANVDRVVKLWVRVHTSVSALNRGSNVGHDRA